MMGTRKYLCWVIVALMFLAAVSGGCGGSGGGGSSSSSPTTNENETDSGTNDSTNSNGVEGTIEGTWKITSGTLSHSSGVTAQYVEGSASAEQFNITVTESTPDSSSYIHYGNRTITLSGEGIVTNGDATKVTGNFTSDSPLLDDINGETTEIVIGDNTYNLVGTNTYKSDILGDGSIVRTFQLTASSTLQYTYVTNANNPSDGGVTTMTIIMTRIAE